MTQTLELFGRTGSHYTRLVRMFAHDAGLTYAFRDIPDMTVLEPSAYGGHPGLKLPVLVVDGQPLFGAENICRWLSENARTPKLVVWTEDVPSPELSNGQELVWSSMSAQVQIMMATRVFGVEREHPYVAKSREGLLGCLGWLDHQLEALLAYLPTRDASLFEHSLFCLIGHLQFRSSVELGGFSRLLAFHDLHSRLDSAKTTPFVP